jgi:hypothetical protein
LQLLPMLKPNGPPPSINQPFSRTVAERDVKIGASG